MLTPEQLAEIKAHLNLTRKMDSDKLQLCTNVATLLAELDRLQAALTAKDRVLSRFSNSANWIAAYADHGYGYEWVRGDSPITLANQALSEGRQP